MTTVSPPRRRLPLLIPLLALTLAGAAAVLTYRLTRHPKPPPPAPRDPAAAATPSRRSAGADANWLARHAEFAARAARVPPDIDLLFLGDSITDDVRQPDKCPGGAALFDERFGRYRPVNFGIDKDRTEHLLWRIVNGEVPATLHPRVAVILIGTNNTAVDAPPAIAAGITACVNAVRQRLPETKVLLLALFPRAEHPSSDKRPMILDVNRRLAALDDGHFVRVLNLHDRFLEPSGELSRDVMYDYLHPTLKGYQIWFDGMGPLLEEMMR